MISWLTSTYIGKLIATFVISMLPVVELRGGLPYGVGFGLKPLEAFVAAFLGNILPIPFLLLLLEGFLKWLKKREGIFTKFALWLENKAYKNKKTIEKYAAFGLFVLVAIPLPGTGAWTGAIVATVLGMNKKVAFPMICLGVIAAGIIVMGITYGFKAIL